MEDKIKHYKLGNTIQEFEELFGNVPFEDIEKIKKYLLENYISKSKIKETMEEIERTNFNSHRSEYDDGNEAKNYILAKFSKLMEDK